MKAKVNFKALFLWFSNVMANMGGFAFSLMANKKMSLEQMGNIGFYSGVMLLVSIVSMGIGVTANRYMAEYIKKKNRSKYKAIEFLGVIAVVAGLIVMILYVLATKFWQKYFQVEWSFELVLLSAQLFLLMVPLAYVRGVMQAKSSFVRVGVILCLETIVKLGVAGIGFYLSDIRWFLLAWPVSAGVALLVSLCGLKNVWNKQNLTIVKIPKEIMIFLQNTIFLRIGLMLLVTIDVILAKHYLGAYEAGIYILLSLTGRIIFFISQTFYVMLTPLISMNLDNDNKARETFISIVGLMILVLGMIIGGLLIWPKLILGSLWGNRYQLIMPYMYRYLLVAIMMAVLHMTTWFELLKNRYLMAYVIIVGLVIEVFLYSQRHENIGQMVNNMLWVNVSLILFYVWWKLWQRRKLVRLDQVVDRVDVAD